MPKDPSIKSVLVIGSGPIVIGQACEFDYSGTQAIKVLKSEGLRVSLVNSNPATIMTDPEYADRTYVEPLTAEIVEKILERERPDAVLPTVGGQTALNLAVELSKRGVLDRLGIRLIGASRQAVEVGEDRRLFKAAMERIGLDLPKSGFAKTLDEARRVLDLTGLPAVIRPSFTLGGSGGGIAYNHEEFETIVARGLDLSPVHEILIEESVLGWKEYELEVMRDKADNFVVICSIENFDPMGIHTGDSVTVAPAQTLTDREYQAMRNAARKIIREVGERLRGCDRDRVAGVDTHRVDVLDRADDHHVVGMVAHHLELVLLPSEHRLLDEDLVDGARVEPPPRDLDHLVGVLREPGAATTEDERRAHHYRVPNRLGDLERFGRRVRESRRRDHEPDLLHRDLEA